MAYPTTFAETLQPITADQLDDTGALAAWHLQKEGLEIVAGLRKADLSEINRIAGQEDVLEFCPNDLKSRFTDTPTATEWLKKDGGRGMSLLRPIGSENLLGYGWLGQDALLHKADRTPQQQLLFDKFVSTYPTTSAYRLDEKISKLHLAHWFAAVVVSTNTAIWEVDEPVGLETWASNGSAVGAYLKAGATPIWTHDDYRPTRKPSPSETDGKRRDIRLFMGFLRTLKSAI